MIDSGRLVMRPSVAARGDLVGIAYTAVIPDVGAKIFHVSSLDRGATFGAPAAVVVGNGDSMQPSLELDPANASHVLFTDRATPGAATHRVFFARTMP